MCQSSAPGRSERNGLSLIDLFKRFPDDKSAREWFEDIRWSKTGRYCPICGSDETGVVPNEIPMPYHCKDCRKYFSVRTGTVMQSSRVPLQKWVIAIYLMSTSLKGVSSMKLHRDLDVTQKTAWMLAQKIREGFMAGTKDKLNGTVEVDETYIGGKESNKHANKKLHLGRGTVGKIAVLGAKQRDGRIIAHPIKIADKETLHGFINKYTEPGTNIMTDEHTGYTGLKGRNHKTVCHSIGEYVDGMAHTNGIESFWSLFKRGYHGTFHKMSGKHLHRYVNEFAGRHNIRGKDTTEQMASIAEGFIGKRLRYVDLVEG